MNRMIILDAAEQVACPRCSNAFALSDGISRQTIERYADEFEKDLGERRKRLEAELAAEAKRRAEQAAASAREKYEAELKAQKEALAAKEAALSKLRSDELDLRRKLREAEEKRQNQELEYQRKLDAERKAIEEKARASASADFERREAQYKAQIESAKQEASDLKRKLEQGSQQNQGEALELGLEAMLKAAFPLDEVVPVPKGVNGADLLQRVRSPSGQLCGTIIWEAKETKNWSQGWLRKLKDDQQAVGAEIAILVTSAMPRDTREPFLRDSDVWITRFPAARPLAEALRNTLLEMHKLRQANSGRSEKMELLYNYICSPQFAQRVRSVVDGFTTMK
ncbi:MAG: DUF2130 domain-containing protein, partial [Betaproteobacteria bacterium]